MAGGGVLRVINGALLVIIVLHGFRSIEAFMGIQKIPTKLTQQSLVRTRTAISMSSRASSDGTSRRPKKTLVDRTQAETVSLVQDIVRSALEAGPRAGPTRTFKAYVAISQTLQEFLPRPGQTDMASFSPPKVLRTLFEKLGATYVKLGQFVASSPTLFPKEYVVEFQKCLDSTHPVEWSIIKRVIESELGPISKSFAYVDTKPLASASIAQVHAATLKTGEDVVIKVQKPGIDECLKADLSFIYVASRVLEFLQPDWERTSLSAIAGDIKTSMLEELDFEKESRNTEEFRRFLAENKFLNQAAAPKVYRDFTTKKVFTMERLNGISLLDEESISKVTSDPKVGQQTIITALNIWTESVSKMPWFHADVHAGNLLLLNDGRVGFIDFGIVGRVSENTFSAVNDLSMALALADYTGMAEALCKMGATDEKVDTEKFGRDIEMVMRRISTVQPDITVAELADGTVAGSIDFDDTEITNVLLEIVTVTEDNGLKLPREFGLLVKQSLYFDRYLKILAPGVDVMNDSRFAGLGAVEDVPQINGNGQGNVEVVIDV